MKIQLNYNPATGQITDNNSVMLFSWPGLDDHAVNESEAKATDIDELIKLKNAGFDTDDLVELRKKEII